jgi:hypothetical protein
MNNSILNSFLILPWKSTAMCIYNPSAKEKGEKNFKAFTSKKGQTFDGILFVTKNAAGNIWFGGQYRQLFRFDGETVTDFTKP